MKAKRVTWVAHHACGTRDTRAELKWEMFKRRGHLGELRLDLRILLNSVLWKCVVVKCIKTSETIYVTGFARFLMLSYSNTLQVSEYGI
jgi:hypothetical protein